MSIDALSKVHFEKNWGIFIGTFSDNLPHQHYAVQVSIALEGRLTINQLLTFEHCLIASNVPHSLSCESRQLILLVYPTSTLGYFLKNQAIAPQSITVFNNPFAQKLQTYAQAYVRQEISFEKVLDNIRALIHTIEEEYQHQDIFGDGRVKTAIHYLEKNYERVVSLEEISDVCCLSSSRFLHLFKAKTGITFRRIQLWHKISQSFTVFPRQSITQTAHQFGFTDSAHYSKVFKSTFGFSPRSLLLK